MGTGAEANNKYCYDGYGEPLYNFESVRDGILTMSDDAGLSISKRKITLSTSGIVPKINGG